MAKNIDFELTEQHVDTFERIRYQIKQLHNDISVLSKKSPNDPINKFKLNIVNEKLADANLFLTEAFKPSKNFDEFDIDELPSNSDVVVILSQYLDALEAWRSSRVHQMNYDWFWKTSDGSKIETDKPTRYRSVK